MEGITASIKSLSLYPGLKSCCGLIVACLSYVFGLGNPEMWVLIGTLIFIDTLSGVTAAYHTGKKITSSRMFHTFTKIVVYGTAVAMANIAYRSCVCCVEHNCPEEAVTLLRLAVFGWIVTTETKSVNENLAALGYKIPSIIEETIQKRFKK